VAKGAAERYKLRDRMNSTIAVDQNPSGLEGSGIPRGILIAALLLVGVILLYVANHCLCRHHKAGHRRRY
jgi:hypothetical protein